MGDKSASRGGVPTKFIMMRKKFLILMFSFSFLLVLVIWNSSPLNRVSNDNTEEAEHFRVASTLQHKDNLNVQNGQNQDVGPTLKPRLEIGRPNEERPEDNENAPGNRNSQINRLMTQIFEEIRSQSLPYSTITTKDLVDSGCEGKYIYVYDLPPKFNVELVEKCDSLFPSFNLCDSFVDSGIGKPVDAKENSSVLPPGRWFNTNQYALELVFHARIKTYKCLTPHPDQASLFYIPFYAGLDVIRWNFAIDQHDVKKHDELSLQLLEWLEQQPSWRRRGGVDHVIALGKISWDFRRPPGNHTVWGSRLLEMQETQQVTKLLIERNPWAKNDIGVPHPTWFHPKSPGDIEAWQQHIKTQNRSTLASFVGNERPGTANVRSELVRQCRNATESCRVVKCKQNWCQSPQFVTTALLASHFCLQPVGDSPTRRSVFDSLIAGCIPVLFHPQTAFVQYPWHLPAAESSWSVYISEDAVKAGSVNVMTVLHAIPPHQRDAMRAFIIDSIVPGLVYRAPAGDVRPFRDAFDITIAQLLHRVSHWPPHPAT